MNWLPTRKSPKPCCSKRGLIRRIQEQMSIDDKKEQGFYDGMTSVDIASDAFDDQRPLQFGDVTEWRRVVREAAARGWNNSANA